jgi:hypothetical protein
VQNSSHEASTYFFILLYESFICTAYMCILKTFFFGFLGWNRTESTGLLYQTLMMDNDECGAIGGMLGSGKPKYSEKNCPSAALSTTNPT